MVYENFSITSHGDSSSLLNQRGYKTIKLFEMILQLKYDSLMNPGTSMVTLQWVYPYPDTRLFKMLSG